MSEAPAAVLDLMKGMTLLDAASFVKEAKKTFGLEDDDEEEATEEAPAEE